MCSKFLAIPDLEEWNALSLRLLYPVVKFMDAWLGIGWMDTPKVRLSMAAKYFHFPGH